LKKEKQTKWRARKKIKRRHCFKTPKIQRAPKQGAASNATKAPPSVAARFGTRRAPPFYGKIKNKIAIAP
jgi:hypothetical protein